LVSKFVEKGFIGELFVLDYSLRENG